MERHYNESLSRRLHDCPSATSNGIAQVIVEAIAESDLVGPLSTHHWLMGCELRDDLITVLTRHKAGTVLTDVDGHFWYRRAKMVCTHHRFISSVEDDQERYYEQKYLLTVPITPESVLHAICCIPWELAQLYIEHGFLSEEEADSVRYLSLGREMRQNAGCLI